MLILGIAFAMNLVAMNPVLNGNASNMGSENNMSAFIMEYNFEDEPYINDIPFNTEEIYLMVTSATPTFDFEEEAYINDIPLYIECVTADCFYEKALAEEYLFEDESFVNDIPFDTYAITKYNCNLYLQALNK